MLCLLEFTRFKKCVFFIEEYIFKMCTMKQEFGLSLYN